MSASHTISTMSEAENYLHQFFTSKWTYALGRMEYLMDALRHPESAYPIIHVTGTAGKGSTSYIAASILQSAGYRVGLNTSPHLVNVRERIMVDRTPISEDDFVTELAEMIPVIEMMKESYVDGVPSYFEITTALAFQHFARVHVTAAVIEVGMGGKFDATNVVRPAVSIVTNIGFDHTEVLGDTLEAIASDKREIIKPSSVAITAVTQPNILQIIKEKSQSVHVPCRVVGEDIRMENVHLCAYRSIVEMASGRPTEFDYVSDTRTVRGLSMSISGKHQIRNAACAITAVTESPFSVDDAAIRHALTTLRYPGRMEYVRIGNVHVILDGAHNPMKMESLATALAAHIPGVKFDTLMAVKGDKDAASMIRTLAPLVSRWFAATLERQTDRGENVMLGAEMLADAISSADSAKGVQTIPYLTPFLNDLRDGVIRVEGDTLLITGSLYLIGAVKEWMENH